MEIRRTLISSDMDELNPNGVALPFIQPPFPILNRGGSTGRKDLSGYVEEGQPRSMTSAKAAVDPSNPSQCLIQRVASNSVRCCEEAGRLSVPNLRGRA